MGSRQWAVSSGFSLVETLVSLGLLTGALISLAQLFAISTESNLGSRTATYAVVLAQQKLEELRALTYAFGDDGMPLTDFESDTSASIETATGGTGLSPSPASSLDENAPGYVDHLDGFGTKLGAGPQPPGGAVYTRRWSIEPLPADPANVVVIQVLVTRQGRAGVAPSTSSRVSADARLVTLRTRKAR